MKNDLSLRTQCLCGEFFLRKERGLSSPRNYFRGQECPRSAEELNQPILDFEVGDSAELAGVGGDDR
jgi:hypothetical protein